jgi:pimeloyl-ACP methyl ester carboxylesterase
MEKLAAAGVLAAALLVAGCSGAGFGTVGPTNTTSGNGNPGGSTPVTAKASNTALFQPLQGILPFPTDLYFAGSTDGTLNIQPANQLSPNQAALNALDGFSTTAVIRASFGGALDPASLANPGSVIVLQVTTDNTTKATVGVVQPLQPGVDYTVGVGPETGVGNSILEIRPTHPLMPSTCIQNGQFLGANCKTGNGYLVFLTTGITVGGQAAKPDTDYANIKAALPSCAAITDTSLNNICKLVGAHLQIARNAIPQLDPANIVLSFSFTTQSINDTLAVVAQQIQAAPAPPPIKVQPTGLTTKDLVPQLPAGSANVYVGTLQLPYFLSRTSPLTEYWHAPAFPLDTTSTFTTRFNPAPKATEVLSVPVLLTVPKGATKPATGWPLVIFQHGITGNRTNMVPLGEAFAQAGFAVIAIDLPLHGITDPKNPLYASAASPFYAHLGMPATGSIERTFDLDVMNNTSQAPGPDGVIDSSGSHFINLASLLTSRDNLREATADLLALAKAVTNLDVDGDGTADIDPNNVHFVGHSLGAITGATFLGLNTSVSTATLAMPGGGIASLLRQSPTFGPAVTAGLQSQSQGLLVPGTTLFEEFFRDAQTVVDSGDPWNYMTAAVGLHRMHLIQVVGSSTSPPDQVIPNFATQRLIDFGMLKRVPAAGVAPDLTNGLRVYVNFTAGSHASILDPTSSLAATAEMQKETVTFAASQGTALPPPDATVVQP